jgi:hypothetical protein
MRLGPYDFKPIPGLTLAVAICLPILIGLGAWQYSRWQWKLGVLDEIDAAVTAEPLPGLQALNALPAGAPIDFRRIQLDQGVATGPAWHLYDPLGSIRWRPFRRVESGGQDALVAFRTIEDRDKDGAVLPSVEGPRAGYVRRIRPRTGFAALMGADHNPALNRWFAVNPDGAWMEEASVYIELDPQETDADALPVRRPDIANNHVSYMLTWWSFALILLVIYAILHRRAGRLNRVDRA